jgi:ATP-dependent Lon protease
LEENGLTETDLQIPDETLQAIARHYTREAGVRNLEREIANLCRKIARKVAEATTADDAPRPTFTIEPKDLEEYLGPEKFQSEMGGKEAQIGVSTGLAWTPRGGEILFIETVRMPGKGGLTLTGQLGDVMKESAQIALDFLRANGKQIGIANAECEDNCNLHVHVPAGAIPKDGPSAGVALTVAIASQLSQRPARHDIAMTGEVTLTGRVLPVGGIKEKVLAARQAGITNLILPGRNRADVKDIPEETRKELHFDFIHDVREAIEKVLLPDKVAKKARAQKAPDVTTPAEQDTGHK